MRKSTNRVAAFTFAVLLVSSSLACAQAQVEKAPYPVMAPVNQYLIADRSVEIARAQEAERPYPKMLPLSQYLMDRNAAIALARSAAPDGISRDASVLVLTPKGWETAVKGTNGFVCMAGPSWTASIDFYDLWSPKQRGAICLNPPAVRSILPIFRKLTEMTLAGVTSVKERIAGIQEAYAKKEIPPVEPGAMSFMMSKDAYLTHLGNSHNLCHVMFFLPIKDPAELNADDPNAPIFSTSIWFPDPEKPDSPLNKELPPLRTVPIEVPYWSDGTQAFH